MTRAGAMERPVRVLLAAPLPPPRGGIAGWTERMLAHARPHTVQLSHVDTATHLLHHYAAPIGVQRLWRQAHVTLRFMRRLVASRPDVLHITTSYDTAFLRDGLFVLLGRLAGAGVILNIRGGDFERFYREQSPFRRRVITRILKMCSAVIPVTQETRTFLRTLGIQRAGAIANCVDLHADPARLASPVRRWIFVGWVMPAKGIPELLEALAAVPDATLTIVGPAVEQDGVDGSILLRGLVTRLQLGNRLQHIPDLPHEQLRDLYRQHDILVFPTRREGFPNVVLEAMEAGLAIVASRVGAIPEMIRDGKDGLLVNPQDVPALVDAVRRVTGDVQLARRLGRSARERVEAAFTVPRVAAEWYDLYARVAGNTADWHMAPPPIGVADAAEDNSR